MSASDTPSVKTNLPDLWSLIRFLYCGVDTPAPLHVTLNLLLEFSSQLTVKCDKRHASPTEQLEILCLLKALNHFLHRHVTRLKENTFATTCYNARQYLELAVLAARILLNLWLYYTPQDAFLELVHETASLGSNGNLSQASKVIDHSKTSSIRAVSEKIFEIISGHASVEAFATALGLQEFLSTGVPDLSEELQSSSTQEVRATELPQAQDVWDEREMTLNIALEGLDALADIAASSEHLQCPPPPPKLCSVTEQSQYACVLFRLLDYLFQLISQFAEQTPPSYNLRVHAPATLRQLERALQSLQGSCSKFITAKSSLFFSKYGLTRSGMACWAPGAEAFLVLFRVARSPRSSTYWTTVKHILLYASFPLLQSLLNGVKFLNVDKDAAEGLVGSLCLLYEVLYDALPFHASALAEKGASPLQNILLEKTEGNSLCFGAQLWIACGLFIENCTSDTVVGDLKATMTEKSQSYHSAVENLAPSGITAQSSTHPCLAHGVPVASSILQVLYTTYLKDAEISKSEVLDRLRSLAQQRGVIETWLPLSPVRSP